MSPKNSFGQAPAGLDHQACYAAFAAHDHRFDGRFFVGISSTGIYCRPVCRVRMPKAENCSFHTSAAAAEAAGFRPCLKCRPELAPGQAPLDSGSRLARQAAGLMDDDDLNDDGLAGLAERLGITDRHLRRVFAAEYGVTPVSYLQTKRLLLAKSLLTDTRLPVTQIAFAAGFGSLRRFNDIFKKRYRLSPLALRKQSGSDEADDGDSFVLKLGYRPPYDWDGLLAFLAARTIPGVEETGDGVYRRTVAIEGEGETRRGWITVHHLPREKALAVTLSPTLLPVVGKVLSRVRNLFDLNCDPEIIFEALKVMNDHQPGLSRPGTRLPGSFDPFEMAVRAILGQQITVKAARTLATRLAQNFGQTLTTPFSGLTHTFPTPQMIGRLDPPIEGHLGPLGIIGARARCILALAEALISGRVSLSPSADPEAEMKALSLLPGFGPWTVQYLAMRALSWPDAFPHTDYGVKKALPGLTPKQILLLAGLWSPWRSYATINLWASL